MSNRLSDDVRDESAFEVELRGRLDVLAQRAPTAPTTSRAPAHPGRAARPGVRERLGQQRWAVAAAAAVIMLIGGVLIQSSNSSGPSSVAAGGSGAGTGTWTPLPPAPSGFEERTFAATAWTGSEAVFWAGSNLARDYVYANGASYNPETGAWSALSVPGWGHPGLSTAYFDGSMYATAKGRGHRFDVDTGELNDLAPMTDIVLAATVATDDGIYGLGPRSSVGDGATLEGEEIFDVGVARYFPDTDTWGAPIFLSNDNYDADVYLLLIEEPPIWTGSEIVVWNPNQDQNLAFDPTSETWRRLPSLEFGNKLPPSGPPDTSVSQATGVQSTLVAVAADSTGKGAVVAHLANGSWRWSDDVLPISVDETMSLAPAGEWVVLISPTDSPITYHVPSGQWFQTDDGPRVREPNTVWTGRELIVWGGAGPQAPDRVTNLVWTPPETG